MKKLNVDSTPAADDAVHSQSNADSTNQNSNQLSSTTPDPKLGVDESNQIDNNQNSDQGSALHSLELDDNQGDTVTKKSKRILLTISIVAVAAGVATGIGSFRLFNQGRAQTIKPAKNIEQVATEEIKKGDVFGVQDSEAFKDSAQGYLEAGGINGEGSHKLLRPGGASQTVYLTSSITDLDKMVGMEVKVWGETFKGQEAGWLMDVGKVEVLNPQGQPPKGEQM